ncbi:ATP-binding cassette domain-containing protein, partial [Methylobacterium oxalidis]|uniref:ATP-binding cassette domain-containing protein n=2 Tax=Methylobacterium oxalidis TaxID=944322 RepID=UPI001FD30D8E
MQTLFRAAEAAPQRLALPRPEGHVEVSGLALTAPGSSRFILSQVSFELPAGSSTAVVGPSGAGKSSLVRALVGIWAPALGSVRIDGSELQHWDADALGQHLGYLPQSVELLSGTIAQNIARFGAVDDEAVLEAAKLAGVHEVIQQLPQGYSTEVGEGGSALSGGQRQRIGLARAIYGNPSLVVLDEPNSNLDAVGEAALAEALLALTKRGTTCVLITHKANILTLVDYILVLKDGTVSTFGPRDEVLAGQGAGR